MLNTILATAITLSAFVTAYAQTSRYLGSVEVASPAALEYGGPYHLDDTTVVYRANGHSAYVLVHPERPGAKAVRLETAERFEGPVYGITRGADGTVYLLTGGGYCDVVSPEWSLFAVALNEDGVWAGERVGAPFEFFASYTQEPVHFDVAADSTLWLTNGLEVVRWRPGGEPKIGTVDEEFVGLSATDGELVAVNRELAYATNGFDGYRLTRDGNGTAVTVLPQEGFSGGRLGRRGDDVYWVSNGKIYIYSGTETEPTVADAPAAIGTAPVTFVNDTLALAVTSAGLVRWDLRTNKSTTQAPYYAETMRWGLRGASVNARGDLAIIGETAPGTAFPLGAIPANHLFLQYAPAGTDPYLPAPEVSFGLSFATEPVPGGQGEALTYAVTLHNESADAIDSARVTGQSRFGAPCPDFWNGARVHELPAGDSATVAPEFDAFYRDGGVGLLRPGRLFDDYFTVAHVNGRPGSGGQLVQFIVTGLQSIVEDLSLEVFPVPALTTVRLRWVGDRQAATVYDPLGRVAFRQNLRAGEREAALDVRVLPEGLYYLALTGSEGTAIRPIQVLH